MILLEMYAGDTISQAREFFEKVRLDDLLALRQRDWELVPNMHFAFAAKHLDQQGSPPGSAGEASEV